jgi:hypothetical protein
MSTYLLLTAHQLIKVTLPLLKIKDIGKINEKEKTLLDICLQHIAANHLMHHPFFNKTLSLSYIAQFPHGTSVKKDLQMQQDLSA